MSVTERIPIGPDDPDEVFVLQATLLAQYRELISQAADDIQAKYPGSKAAAAAFIATIGVDIPDSTILAAVKRLATIKFRLLGMA
jgi:hypothetical protein